jgi:aminoglycoside phosphotransferase family enzyme/predicted kinase
VRSGGGAKADDQRAAIAFLGRPSSYGAGVDRVERIETHVSLVFLAGDRAYKLKRAVKLPYLDFSTAGQRRAACAAELALNRRTAPSLYLNLRRLGRDAAGEIGFVEDGPAVDWVVVMKRFDQGSLFDALAQKGALDGPLMDALADHVAQFHEAAEQRPEQGGAAALADIARTNHQVLAGARGAVFAPESVAAILSKWRTALTKTADLLEARRAAGWVRRCHGDLHLRNICLVDGKPTLFDCLEFSDALASVDVLYDLAFLLMDLVHCGLAAFADRVLNRYLDRTAQDDGLAAMPLFLSLRAGIRAHVTATALTRPANEHKKEKMAEEARRYLDLAHRALEPQPCRLIAIGGLSGSGKSTLAAGLAPELGLLPGARVLRSDVTRKLALGAAPETRLPAAAYTPEITRRVYDALGEKAAVALAAGYTAIVDAVSLAPEERRSFAEIARKAGVPFCGLWLDADAETMKGRVRDRRDDASDATADVLAQQLREDPGPLDWVRVDAGGGAEECLAAARRALAAAV